MPGAYAAPRRDSNFEMVSSIDVRVRTTMDFGVSGPIQADYVLRVDSLRVHCSLHSGPLNLDQSQRQRTTDANTESPHHGHFTSGVRPSWHPIPVASGRIEIPYRAKTTFTKWIEAKAVATITGNQRHRDRANERKPRGRHRKAGTYSWEGPLQVVTGKRLGEKECIQAA
ncbi:hypothetical protein Tco_1449149 [Tanacetum coccineum]